MSDTATILRIGPELDGTLTRKGDTWQEAKLLADATLTLPMLPGFSLPLADVFAPLK